MRYLRQFHRGRVNPREIGFLVQMMELSPEMVAVIFHQGFRFEQPAVMEHLLTLESHDFPEWDTLADGVHLQPWARDLSDVVLRQPMGEWFLTVAAALEYMYTKPGAAPAAQDDDEKDGDEREGDREPGRHPAAYRLFDPNSGLLRRDSGRRFPRDGT